MTRQRTGPRFAEKLIALPRRGKQAMVMLVDVVSAWAAMWLAFTLRLEVWHVPTVQQLWIYAAVPLIFLPVFVRFGLYRAIFRYTGPATMQTLLRAAVVYGTVLLALVVFTFPAGVPRSVGVLQPILFFMLVSNSRAWARFWLNRGARRDLVHRLLIYGAGSAGVQTAAAVSNAGEIQLLGFIDDDPSKIGRSINGIRVYGPKDAVTMAERLGITDILLAVPSASRQRRHEIIETLRSVPVHVRTMPGLADVTSGRVAFSDFQELDVEDLLGREPVPPNPALLARDLAGKAVLVTGAGGSIGSELCRQILLERPSRLVLIEHDEFALYSIHQELTAVLPDSNGIRTEFSGTTVAGGNVQRRHPIVVPLLANVRDFQRVKAIFRDYSPDTVYHAAAYKHVPLVEENTCEGVANNTFGTLAVARASIECGVTSFVLVSTDKAVRPTNVMGASKRLAELILQAFSALTMVRFDHAGAVAQMARNRTRFSMVRFGNVLGSSGSVVPLFRSQVKAGGPLTVTHPEVTRFFMTIPEAAQLVLQAGAMAEGGEVFVLDMGEPVKIMDLARRVVELSGLTVLDEGNPDGDIEIVINGLRPGEKLYEELLIGDDPLPTAHPRILKARERYLDWEELRPALATLQVALVNGDARSTRRCLQQLVSGYRVSEVTDDQIAGMNG
jgi:FlaA1/EpsC-like NDP-sugar epimerase